MQTVTKGDFAGMVGRTPAAVSQWISAGKLQGAALVGEGRRARIAVDVALQQLGMNLDLGQQLAQPRPLIGRSAVAAPVDTDQARLLKARADREELALQVDRAKAAEMDGRWIVSDEAGNAWSLELASLIQSMESWLVTGAVSDVIALESRDPREVARVLRSGFRALRERLSEHAAAATATADEDEEEGGHELSC